MTPLVNRLKLRFTTQSGSLKTKFPILLARLEFLITSPICLPHPTGEAERVEEMY